MSKDSTIYWENKKGLTSVEKQVLKDEARAVSTRQPKGIVYGRPNYEVQSYNVVIDHYNYQQEAISAAKKIASSYVRVFRYNSDGSKSIVWEKH